MPAEIIPSDQGEIEKRKKDKEYWTIFGQISGLLLRFASKEDPQSLADNLLYQNQFAQLPKTIEPTKQYASTIFADFGMDYEKFSQDGQFTTLLSNTKEKPLLDGLKAADKIRTELLTLANDYQRCGKSFGLFTQHQDRANVIKKYTAKFEEDLLTDPFFKPDICKLINNLNEAIKETKLSHQKNSTAGYLHLTESRLANKLTAYVAHLMTEYNISKESLEMDKSGASFT